MEHLRTWPAVSTISHRNSSPFRILITAWYVFSDKRAVEQKVSKDVRPRAVLQANRAAYRSLGCMFPQSYSFAEKIQKKWPRRTCQGGPEDRKNGKNRKQNSAPATLVRQDMCFSTNWIVTVDLPIFQCSESALSMR